MTTAISITLRISSHAGDLPGWTGYGEGHAFRSFAYDDPTGRFEFPVPCDFDHLHRAVPNVADEHALRFAVRSWNGFDAAGFGYIRESVEQFASSDIDGVQVGSPFVRGKHDVRVHHFDPVV